ncbi:LysE family translocator [Stappia sp. ES.058]|uniref:LysE family translocator n=1 Tax=Stappia sp. ES.058 TaxID=1881061 RepID=UPI00087DC981|nr:LysE family transporter [Stappia sp. ES.058]SDT92853.1 Threonine/homoserine/homoserine lactone efflux protein [Stappia sp. ES.058]
MSVFFLIGIAIGVATSAPVGPVNIAAIQRAFRSGFLPGLFAGAGAVLADGIYAGFAAFGITAVSDFVERHSGLIQITGGMLVILFGARVLAAHPHFTEEDGPPSGLLAGMVTGFAITITNPGVVLGFLAIFGSLGKWAPDPGDYAGATAMVAGVVAGATGWWVFISATVSRLRARITDAWLVWINRASGGLLIVFGLAIFGHLLLGG